MHRTRINVWDLSTFYQNAKALTETAFTYIHRPQRDAQPPAAAARTLLLPENRPEKNPPCQKKKKFSLIITQAGTSYLQTGESCLIFK